MNDPNTKPDPTNARRGMFDEADIGSGEKSPGQHETEEMIREIPPLPAKNRQADEPPPGTTGSTKGNGVAREEGNRQGG